MLICSFKDVHLDCPTCKLGKRKRLPFPTYDEIIKDFFDLIHRVFGKRLHLFHTHITNTSLYSLMITTDLDGFIFYMLSLKYVMLFKNLFPSLPINFLKSSKSCTQTQRGKYVSKQIQEFLRPKGIFSQHTCPYTPQQNGVAEQKNRHLLDVA